MILVDSSVWIDYFKGADLPQTALLDKLLGVKPLAIGDLILTEVLQGFRDDGAFEAALASFKELEFVELGGFETALQAARNFRALRVRGVTVRKTIDTIIATRCILDGHELLFSDRDFQPFVEHLGLVDAMGAA